MDFVKVMDWRGFPDIPRIKWRTYLRKTLYDARYVSDLSHCALKSGFDMHEGIIQRRWVSLSNEWSPLIFSGINCFLLSPTEHRLRPPNRTECYWLAVARYTKTVVDAWIESLPFKVPISTPWRGTHGLLVVAELPSRFPVCLVGWDRWYAKVAQNLDCEG